jgi:type IV pilus assembly protein PilA
MLLHKLRARAGARLSGESEAGFTLVELLVVMLILGILAAIAIPAFFNQKEKANDSQAKAYAHSAQVAMETYATDNGGAYTNANVNALTSIEPTLNGAGANLNPTVQGPQAYTIAVTSPVTGNIFTVTRTAAGNLTYTCQDAGGATGNGGCPPGGNWGQ